MTGFIAAYRDALDHPLFKGHADRLGAWTWLLMRAAWKPTKIDVSGKTVTVNRGQLSVSIRHLSEAWGWSKSSTDRFITRLKTETMIETNSGTGRLLITICNYEKYQDISKDAGTPSGTPSGTGAGQERDTKEQGNKETRVLEDDESSSVDGLADEAIALWNMAAEKGGWKKIIAATPARRTKVLARIKTHGIEGWKNALRTALRGEALGRDPPSWWSFDFITKNNENILKVLEGNYDKRFGRSSGHSDRNDGDGGTLNPMVKAVVKAEANDVGEQSYVYE